MRGAWVGRREFVAWRWIVSDDRNSDRVFSFKLEPRLRIILCAAFESIVRIREGRISDCFNHFRNSSLRELKDKKTKLEKIGKNTIRIEQEIEKEEKLYKDNVDAINQTYKNVRNGLAHVKSKPFTIGNEIKELIDWRVEKMRGAEKLGEVDPPEFISTDGKFTLDGVLFLLSFVTPKNEMNEILSRIWSYKKKEREQKSPYFRYYNTRGGIALGRQQGEDLNEWMIFAQIMDHLRKPVKGSDNYTLFEEKRNAEGRQKIEEGEYKEGIWDVRTSNRYIFDTLFFKWLGFIRASGYELSKDLKEDLKEDLKDLKDLKDRASVLEFARAIPSEHKDKIVNLPYFNDSRGTESTIKQINDRRKEQNPEVEDLQYDDFDIYIDSYDCYIVRYVGGEDDIQYQLPSSIRLHRNFLPKWGTSLLFPDSESLAPRGGLLHALNEFGYCVKHLELARDNSSQDNSVDEILSKNLHLPKSVRGGSNVNNYDEFYAHHKRRFSSSGFKRDFDKVKFILWSLQRPIAYKEGLIKSGGGSLLGRKDYQEAMKELLAHKDSCDKISFFDDKGWQKLTNCLGDNLGNTVNRLCKRLKEILKEAKQGDDDRSREQLNMLGIRMPPRERKRESILKQLVESADKTYVSPPGLILNYDMFFSAYSSGSDNSSSEDLAKKLKEDHQKDLKNKGGATKSSKISGLDLGNYFTKHGLNRFRSRGQNKAGSTPEGLQPSEAREYKKSYKKNNIIYYEDVVLLCVANWCWDTYCGGEGSSIFELKERRSDEGGLGNLKFMLKDSSTEVPINLIGKPYFQHDTDRLKKLIEQANECSEKNSTSGWLGCYKKVEADWKSSCLVVGERIFAIEEKLIEKYSVNLSDFGDYVEFPDLVKELYNDRNISLEGDRKDLENLRRASIHMDVGAIDIDRDKELLERVEKSLGIERG